MIEGESEADRLRGTTDDPMEGLQVAVVQMAEDGSFLDPLKLIHSLNRWLLVELVVAVNEQSNSWRFGPDCVSRGYKEGDSREISGRGGTSREMPSTMNHSKFYVLECLQRRRNCIAKSLADAALTS